MPFRGPGQPGGEAAPLGTDGPRPTGPGTQRVGMARGSGAPQHAAPGTAKGFPAQAPHTSPLPRPQGVPQAGIPSGMGVPPKTLSPELQGEPRRPHSAPAADAHKQAHPCHRAARVGQRGEDLKSCTTGESGKTVTNPAVHNTDTAMRGDPRPRWMRMGPVVP